jgi:tryptophan-rich sensory protein
MKPDPATPRPASLSELTDSPWLWCALFTAVGLSALLATGGKFGKRQAGIERKYQARTGVATGEVRIETQGSGAKTVLSRPEYSTPEKTVVPLWPLEILLAVLCATSIALLLRDRWAGAAMRDHGSDNRAEPPHEPV